MAVTVIQQMIDAFQVENAVNALAETLAILMGIVSHLQLQEQNTIQIVGNMFLSIEFLEQVIPLHAQMTIDTHTTAKIMELIGHALEENAINQIALKNQKPMQALLVITTLGTMNIA